MCPELMLVLRFALFMAEVVAKAVASGSLLWWLGGAKKRRRAQTFQGIVKVVNILNYKAALSP